MSANDVFCEIARLEEWRKGVDEKLGQILAQTTATNGRVRSLEDSRNRQYGQITVWGLFLGLVGALAVKLLAWFFTSGKG